MKEQRRKIAVAHPALLGNEKKYVQECLETCWISSAGRFIPLFEREFACFCGVEHAVACDTGTSAIHLILAALNVSAGDEVIVPTLTFVATANAVQYCGARPVFADSEPTTMNIDPNKIEELITPNTRGIVVVHLYGHPAEMDQVREIARWHNLFVVEDAAEAHGAQYRGRTVGSIGDAASFSFYGNKIITTGEGGMVTTPDRDLAERVRLLRGQGMHPERRYWFPVVGYNYRMTNIQAAIGLAQLERVDEHLAARRRVAEWYGHYLRPFEDSLRLPVEELWAHHAYWMYTVILKDSVEFERDAVMQELAADGIETRPVFFPMHMLPPYHGSGGKYPVAEALAGRGISLPTHALLTEEDAAYVAERLGMLCQTARKRTTWSGAAI